MTTASATNHRGRKASHPGQLSLGAWRDILLRMFYAQSRDNISMISAGVAFYAFLAIFPAVAGLVSLYGLVADPVTITRQISSLAYVLPEEARKILIDQFTSVAAKPAHQLSLSLVFSLALTLWSAASGMKAMVTAINIAYEENDTRSFIRSSALALGLTLGSLLFVLIAVALVIVVPAVVAFLHVNDGLGWWLSLARWPLLAVMVMAGVAFLYRVAPVRPPAQWQWISGGAMIATLLWLVVSGGFSYYVSNFGSYDKTYGSVGAVVVLLFWFYLTAYIVLLGAALNAEMERQIKMDTPPE